MDVSSRRGLFAVRTKAEMHASLETTTAYVVEIPVKAANRILKAADSMIHNHSIPSLHHLRRFVKTENLPPHLENITCPCQVIDSSAVGRPETSCIADFTLTGNDLVHGFSKEKQNGSNEDNRQTLHFLVCATSSISFEDVTAVLKSCQPHSARNLLYGLRTLTVPLLPPTSDEQAKQWSRSHWPTIYKRNNPYGPHWKIISEAEREIMDQTENWIDLARSAGEAVFRSRLGEAIGAVIVDRNSDRTPLLIVTAGDARWAEVPMDARSGCGNVMAHAVMRAIGLVARKRKELAEEKDPEAGGSDLPRVFADKLLTSVESDAYSVNEMTPGGYLCLGLEIYVTHEPCVMCSMAILHSRFARVIFGKRLPRTGGISAGVAKEEVNKELQPSLAYGLFWRPELSWKLLAWQWEDGRSGSRGELPGPGLHA